MFKKISMSAMVLAGAVMLSVSGASADPVEIGGSLTDLTNFANTTVNDAINQPGPGFCRKHPGACVLSKDSGAAAKLPGGLNNLPDTSSTLPAPNNIPPKEAPGGINVDIHLGGGGELTCSQAKRVVRANGFRKVRTLDCSGGEYVFAAKKGMRKFEITVSNEGDIVDVSRI